MNNLPWQIEKIIAVANQLQRTGHTAASAGECIAAAFVLNHMEYLPGDYTDIIEAWDLLGHHWQASVRQIKRDYMHLVETG
jgi:hypothetical protein